MPTYNIYITNNDSGCTEVLSASTTVTSCTTFFLRIPENSKADGPFNIYTGSTSTIPIYSAKTVSDLLSGVSISFLCP